MTAHNVPGSADERQVADTVRDQRQAEAAQRSVERFRQTAAELRTQAQSFDDLATEWEKRVAFYSEQIDGPKLLLPGECPHETTFLKVRPDGWACRDCGAAIPAQRDGRIAPMPGGGDTVFGVPSRHGRENFPPASGTDTPLVASGEPNESDSSEKRHNDGQADG